MDGKSIISSKNFIGVIGMNQNGKMNLEKSTGYNASSVDNLEIMKNECNEISRLPGGSAS